MRAENIHRLFVAARQMQIADCKNAHRSPLVSELRNPLRRPRRLRLPCSFPLPAKSARRFPRHILRQAVQLDFLHLGNVLHAEADLRRFRVLHLVVAAAALMLVHLFVARIADVPLPGITGFSLQIEQSSKGSSCDSPFISRLQTGQYCSPHGCNLSSHLGHLIKPIGHPPDTLHIISLAAACQFSCVARSAPLYCPWSPILDPGGTPMTNRANPRLKKAAALAALTSPSRFPRRGFWRHPHSRHIIQQLL